MNNMDSYSQFVYVLFGVGEVAVLSLFAWALWSKRQEDKHHRQQRQK